MPVLAWVILIVGVPLLFWWTLRDGPGGGLRGYEERRLKREQRRREREWER